MFKFRHARSWRPQLSLPPSLTPPAAVVAWEAASRSSEVAEACATAAEASCSRRRRRALGAGDLPRRQGTNRRMPATGLCLGEGPPATGLGPGAGAGLPVAWRRPAGLGPGAGAGADPPARETRQKRLWTEWQGRHMKRCDNDHSDATTTTTTTARRRPLRRLR